MPKGEENLVGMDWNEAIAISFIVCCLAVTISLVVFALVVGLIYYTQTCLRILSLIGGTLGIILIGAYLIKYHHDKNL